MNRCHQRATSKLPSLKSLYNRSSLIAILFSVALVGIVMGSIGITKLLNLAQMNLLLVSRSASVAIEAAVYFDDREIILEQLNQLLPDADVLKAQLTLTNNDTLEVWTLSDEHQLNFIASILVSGLLNPVSEPIKFKNQQLAMLTLWPNGEFILRFMLIGFLALILSLLITAVIILVATRRLHQMISTPLLELAQVSTQVRANRDFSVRVRRSHIAEIDSFCMDFNELLEELQQWHVNMDSLNKHLHFHANHDALTGIANRDYFEKSLQRALEVADDNHSQLTILYIDCNDFKLINDNYGHAAGDDVLRAMTHRINSVLRKTDMVARVGGDEFCILLNHVGNLTEVNDLSQKIIGAVNQPLNLTSDTRINLSVSLGFARYPDDGNSIDALMNAADFDMYANKKNQKSSLLSR